MGELAQLKARIEAARRFEHTLGAARFTLAAPTDHEMRVYAARARAEGAADVTTMAVMMSHAMLLAAVRGWEGVTESDLLADGGADPVPFDPSLVGDLADARPEWAAELVTALHARLAARKSRSEAAAKN